MTRTRRGDAKPARTPSRDATRRAAWRTVIRSRTPRRGTTTRAALDVLLVDAMVGRLERENARALEMQVDAAKIAERAGAVLEQSNALMAALQKRLAEIDESMKARTGALN